MSQFNGTDLAATLAAQFQKQASFARKEVDLPIPGIPNMPEFKFRCVLRRIDALTLVRKSVLPDALKRMILGLKPEKDVADIKAAAEEAARSRVEQMTIEDLEAIREFQREVAQKTCIAPKIAYSPTDDPGTINLASDECEFGHQIVEALYNYAMGLSPAVPVPMVDGGETTVAAVEEFSDSSPGRTVLGGSANGEELS